MARAAWFMFVALGVACTPLKAFDLEGGDAASPESAGLSGMWVGTTSQGRLLRLRVHAGAVVEVETHFRTTGCITTGVVRTTFSPPVPIAPAGTFARGPAGGEVTTLTIEGTFTTIRAANGLLSLNYAAPGCSGAASVTWQAQRVVCGDGTEAWPETCDDGNQKAGDGCSEICQLAVTPESEPNDDVGRANGPFSAAALVTAALAAGDIDVFAVRNPHPGPVAVAFETFGQTPGTCTAGTGLLDTTIEVVDAAGAVLAVDDDGSRAYHCSALSHSIPGGQTVYVRVRQSAGGAVPAYGLHVRFQKS